jgi:glutathione synthase/RimK-type ligase-like ATP-grasp enzyme
VTVLLLTHTGDNESVDAVARELRRRGAEVRRLDTDRFPTDVRVAASLDGEDERLTVAADGWQADLDGVTAVWRRRIAIARGLPASMDAQHRRASIRESETTLLSVLGAAHAFVMDPLEVVRTARNKLLQLRRARELGLAVPRTLTTNDPAAVRELAASCPSGIVTKMLSSFAIETEAGAEVVFTTPVGPEDLEHLEGLALCPMTFQERVPKRLELRVAIVGERVFAASIDSQRLERARVDWRREGLALLGHWEAYELPADVRRGLLALMDGFGLNYGALDLIVTPEGRHVLLEVNPLGEYAWLERRPGLAISAAIADVLLDRAPRREPGAGGPGAPA